MYFYVFLCRDCKYEVLSLGPTWGRWSLMNPLGLRGFHWQLLISPDTGQALLSMAWLPIGIHQSQSEMRRCSLNTHIAHLIHGSRASIRYSVFEVSTWSWPGGPTYCSAQVGTVTPQGKLSTLKHTWFLSETSAWLIAAFCTLHVNSSKTLCVPPEERRSGFLSS